MKNEKFGPFLFAVCSKKGGSRTAHWKEIISWYSVLPPLCFSLGTMSGECNTQSSILFLKLIL